MGVAALGVGAAREIPRRMTRRFAADRGASLTLHARAPRGVTSLDIHPGESLWLGRGSCCALRLRSDAVSRLHLRLAWPVWLLHPFVTDPGSRNGSALDGQPLAIHTPTPLPPGAVLELGDVTVHVLPGEHAPTATQVSDLNELVFDEGPEVSGELIEPAELERLLAALEAERRTGTLALGPGGELGVLVLCLGRIMFARFGADGGRPAAEAIVAGQPLARGPIPFLFTRRFELEDGAPLELPPHALRASRRGDTRTRPLWGVGDDSFDPTIRLEPGAGW